MRRNLQDSVVVVTGAAGRLGALVARGFAGRGAKVALLDKSGEQLDQMVDQVQRQGHQAAAWPTDIRDADAVQQAFGGIVEHWGRIDILVNAAGVKPEGPIEQTQLDEAMEALQVNYLGPLLCCRAAIPVMRHHGTGHIINVSSVLGKRGTPGRGVYSASKAALNTMTESLRVELMGTGIHVTLVCPGRIAEAGAQRVGLLETSVERAAEQIVRCVDRLPAELVLTPAGRALTWLNAVAPGLVDRIVRRWRLRESREDALASSHDVSRERP